MKETITRVHNVTIAGFLWKDDADNVVPTCTCPSNRNLKDCCAGIMFALQRCPQFADWYGQGFTHHRELLDRRLRADLDPVSVHFDMLSNQLIIPSTAVFRNCKVARRSHTCHDTVSLCYIFYIISGIGHRFCADLYTGRRYSPDYCPSEACGQ